MNKDRLNTEWMKFAACKDMGAELFMSEKKEEISRARAVCLGCPAVKACLEYAIINKESGIWGGTSEKQRRRLRLNNKIIRN